MKKCNKIRLSQLSLSIIFALSVTACGSSSSQDSNNSNTDEPVQVTPDTTPEVFSIAEMQAVTPGEQVQSSPISVTGINVKTAVSVQGGEYSIAGGEFTSENGFVKNGQNIVLRTTAAQQYGTSQKVTLTIGTLSRDFVVTTDSVEYQVDVNLNLSHKKGGVDSFDRSRYITMHIGTRDNEWPDNQTQKQFIEDYDVYYGRNNGVLPWQLNRLKDTAVNGVVDDAQMTTFGNQTKNNYANDTFEHQFENRMSNMMYGGQPSMYPHKEYDTCSATNCYGNDWVAGYDEYARFVSEWLSKYFGDGGTTGEKKPQIIEVMNEPFVHSDDLNSSNANITELHKVVAERLHQDHPGIKVGGYTAAYPALEANNSNFDLFDNTWKTFIDNAGDAVDFYSIHLYDGHNNSEAMFRSGANIEAILDMIEHYSVLQVGEAKPWVISEYGFYSPFYKSTPYSKKEDWWNLRSFSSIMMQLMDKPDQIMTSMPFFILKALWSGNNGVDEEGHRYPSRLFVLEEELDGSINVTDNGGNWVYSELKKFYELWSDVKGKRVDSKPSDLDLQTDAYIDGNTLYFIVNNLEHEDVTFNFNLIDKHNTPVNGISYKHLYFDEAQNAPVHDQGDLTKDTTEFTVNAFATVILKVDYASALTINEEMTETKYYADKFKQPIKANTAVDFAINSVQKGTANGEAVLRLGIGRAHNLSLTPSVTVNGTEIPVPSDFRGYSQDTRDSFFGVIEVPVPYSALQQNNLVKVQFPDAGGFVSSVTMQVFESSVELNRFNQ
ncbi:hypothetical protein [Catenovulum sediminis]|uniref:Agarase n=1 Tax=Catenovulum sediminis TaxID=1740262 RepID=A0ABV1RN80_9ALTE|nr:hypothetical protein [Catenovulum sediminis]